MTGFTCYAKIVLEKKLLSHPDKGTTARSRLVW